MNCMDNDIGNKLICVFLKVHIYTYTHFCTVRISRNLIINSFTCQKMQNFDIYVAIF